VSSSYQFVRFVDPGVAGSYNLTEFEDIYLIWAHCSEPSELNIKYHGHNYGSVRVNLRTGATVVQQAPAISDSNDGGNAYDHEVLLDAILGYRFRWSITDDDMLDAEVELELGNCWTSINFNSVAVSMQYTDYIIGGQDPSSGEMSVVQKVPNPVYYHLEPVNTADQSSIVSYETEVMSTRSVYRFKRALSPEVDGTIDLALQGHDVVLVYAFCSQPDEPELLFHSTNIGGARINLWNGTIVEDDPPGELPTNPEEDYDYSVVLDESSAFSFYWSIVDDQELHGRMLIGKRNCWVGIGFNDQSPSMAGSDYILGHGEQGGEMLRVTQAVSSPLVYARPTDTQDQSVIMSYSADVSEGYSSFEFVRKLKPGRRSDAMDLTNLQEGLYLIFGSCAAANQLSVENHAGDPPPPPPPPPFFSFFPKDARVLPTKFQNQDLIVCL
jgi:hypothetical protein